MSWPEPRSWLFAPASDERKVDNALGSDADAVVLDLEDGVSQSRVAAARDILVTRKQSIRARTCQLRIGMDDHGYREADVATALEIGVSSIRVPKAQSVGTLDRLNQLLDRLDPGADLTLFLTVETALGLDMIHELARCSPRIRGFVFGEHDYTADLGVDPGSPLCGYARASIAVVSRANDLARPTDGAFVEFEDDEGLRLASQLALSYGYGSKSAIHPRQIPIIHEVFTPSADEVIRAEEEIRAFQASIEQGRTVTTSGGRLVDPATVRRAEQLLSRRQKGEM